MTTETQTTKPELVFIPLSKLDVAPENARKTDVAARQDELKASILAYGIVSPLLIRPGDKEGRYLVPDGQRRLLALKQLVKEKKIKATYPVKCEPIDKDRAREISLAVNLQVQGMHPADQFEAFYALSREGLSEADIAARFGVSKKTVRQRLSLASVSPALFDLYRQGGINLEILEAFTLTDNHAKQETIWSQLRPHERRPRHIRNVLTEEKIDAEDERVRFVTIEAYEEAGGDVQRDLFSTSLYITDIDLLNRLVSDKLAQVAKDVQGEGWNFVQVSRSYDSDFLDGFDLVEPQTVELGKKDASRLKAIEAELQKLEEAYDQAESSEAGDAIVEKSDALEAEHDALTEKTKVYTTEQKSTAGAYVTLNGDEPYIVRGLAPAANDVGTPQGGGGTSKAKPEYAKGMRRYVAYQKTAAVQKALIDNPRRAKEVAVTRLLYRLSPHDCHDAIAKLAEQQGAYNAIDALCRRFAEKLGLPARSEKSGTAQLEYGISRDTAWYDAVKSLSDDDLDQLLLLASTLEFGQKNCDEFDKSEHSLFNRVATDLNVQMRDYWRPDFAFLNGRTQKQLAEVAKESGYGDGVSLIAGYKKTELVASLLRHFQLSESAEKPTATQKKANAWRPAVMRFAATKKKRKGQKDETRLKEAA